MSAFYSKISIGITSICSLLFLMLGILGPFLVQFLTDEGIKDGIILKKDNEESWSKTPGDTGVELFRDYTLYNL